MQEIKHLIQGRIEIKKYTANTSKDALNTIYKELGYDATILRVQMTEDGVEIIASARVSPAPSPTNPKLNPQSTPRNSVLHLSKPGEAGLCLSLVTSADTTQSSIPPDETVSNLKDEVRKLRSLMTTQRETYRKRRKLEKHPMQADCVKQLKNLGLQPRLIKQLLEQVANPEKKTVHEITSIALSNLSAQITISENSITSKGGIATLIGPAGAGKTSTLAKLAKLHVKEHGADSTVIISGDNHGMGAYEKLLEIGEDISVPVVKAKNHAELSQLLLALNNKRLVLIDPGNLSQKELKNPSCLATKNIKGQTIRHYLVMAATAKYKVLNHLANGLATDVESCIITKVDEATDLGNMLSMLVNSKLKISFWTDSPQSDGILHKATAQHLITKAVTIIGNTPESIREKLSNAQLSKKPTSSPLFTQTGVR